MDTEYTHSFCFRFNTDADFFVEILLRNLDFRKTDLIARCNTLYSSSHKVYFAD